jgi:hypothetical protein
MSADITLVGLFCDSDFRLAERALGFIDQIIEL